MVIDKEDLNRDEPIDVVNDDQQPEVDISGEESKENTGSIAPTWNNKDETMEINVDVDSRLEKDAAMALLQMHDYQKSTGEKYPLTNNDRTIVPSAKEVKEAPAAAIKPSKPAQKPHLTEREKLAAALQAEHNYFAIPQDSPADKNKHGDTDDTDSASEGEADLVPCLPPFLQLDHGYCQPYFPIEQRAPCQKTPTKRPANRKHSSPDVSVPGQVLTDASVAMEVEVCETVARTPVKGRGSKSRRLSDVTNLKANRELAALLPPTPPKLQFKVRTLPEEVQITYDFLLKGIDSEDKHFLARRYEELLQQDDSPQTFWLNETHWVDHPDTLIPDPSPPKKKRKHYHVDDEVYSVHKTGQFQLFLKFYLLKNLKWKVKVARIN